MLDIFSKEGLLTFLYTLPALLLSLSIHEYAHAWVAYKLGDINQKIKGRLTLNPFAHIDPIGFLSIMLIGVGWGKPVSVDDRAFKDSKKGMMLTALAGPMSNLLLAIFVTIILKLLMVFGLANPMLESKTGEIIISILMYIIQFNIVFCVFNLLERYSFFIIMIIYFTNLTTYIITPGYNLVLKLINWILML